jgi:hypothetical protein
MKVQTLLGFPIALVLAVVALPLLAIACELFPRHEKSLDAMVDKVICVLEFLVPLEF